MSLLRSLCTLRRLPPRTCLARTLCTSKRQPQRRCLLRTVACPGLHPGRSTQAGMWFPPRSYHRRIPRRNNFPGQRCSLCTVGSLNLSCIRFDTCRLRSLGRTSHRARILRSSCMSPVRRWCILPATHSRTRLDNHRWDTLRNQHITLLYLHHNHCDRSQTDTLEQSRMAHTVLCLKVSSCTCLCRRPHRFPPRCRRTLCGFRPGDNRSMSHRSPDQRSLHTRFEPDQSGNHSPGKCLPMLQL